MDLFLDGFAQYNTLNAFNVEKGGYWKGALPSALSYSDAPLGGAQMRRFGTSYADTMFAELEADTQILAASFILEMTENQLQNNIRVGFSPRSWNRDRTQVTTAISAFELRLNGLSGTLLTHTVPTAAAPSNAGTPFTIASNTVPLVAGQAYSVNLLIDIRNPLGIFTVYLNGTPYFEATFNRDRITNGFQPLSMGCLSIVSGGGSNGCWISDIFVYVPNEDRHPFPMPGPIKISYASPNATLATPGDDSTYEEISTDLGREFPMPSGSVPAGVEVIAARAMTRLRAKDAVTSAHADVDLGILGENRVVADTDVPSGFASKMFSATLTPDEATAAAINTSVFKMRSPTT